jgi:hypothetical protein
MASSALSRLRRHRQPLPRAYHAGDADEIRWILQNWPRYPVMAVAAVSLGGSMLLNYLATRAEQAIPVRQPPFLPRWIWWLPAPGWIVAWVAAVYPHVHEHAQTQGPGHLATSSRPV